MLYPTCFRDGRRVSFCIGISYNIKTALWFKRREAAKTARTQEAIKARFKSSQSLLEKALRCCFVEP